MSEEQKQKIEKTKEQFLNEISQGEDELLDEVAGGARGFEDGTDLNCGTNCNCGAN